MTPSMYTIPQLPLRRNLYNVITSLNRFSGALQHKQHPRIRINSLMRYIRRVIDVASIHPNLSVPGAGIKHQKHLRFSGKICVFIHTSNLVLFLTFRMSRRWYST